MIVLDTNQVDRTINGPTMVMLTKLAEATANQLAISSVTLDELLTHHSTRVTDLANRRADAERDLRKLLGETIDELEPASTSRSVGLATSAKRERERQFRERFEVLAVDGESAIEALRREATRVPPATGRGRDSKKGGARDAAIWLSTLKHAKARGERLWFVSADRDAFHVPDLASDIAASGVDVAIVKDIAGLLSGLCDDVSSEVEAEAFATSPVVQSTSLESISNSAAVKLVADSALRPYQSPGRITISQTLTELNLDGFESAEKVHAYRVGQVTWATCRIHWKLTLSIKTLSLTVDDTQVVVPPIALSFVVPSTVLARMDHDILEAEVLDTGGPLRVVPASPA